MQSIDSLLSENVAALSALLHRDSRYHDLYEHICDEVSGFVGIWKLCAHAGAEFTEAEVWGRHIAGETYDWINAIHDFADRVISCCLNGDGPYQSEWRAEADAAIRSHRYQDSLSFAQEDRSTHIGGSSSRHYMRSPPRRLN